MRDNHAKLCVRCAGIPNQVRGMAWCLMMGVERVKQEQEGTCSERVLLTRSVETIVPAGRYKEMLEFALQHSKHIRQIDLDINRTFRNNVMYKDRFDTKQQELFRVLSAYSVYNSVRRWRLIVG